MPHAAIHIRIDTQQVLDLADQVERTAQQTYNAAQKHARKAAQRMLDYVVEETPIYAGQSLTQNEPGGLAGAWRVRNVGGTNYEIYPEGESHSGFTGVALYEDVVYWLTEGTMSHGIPLGEGWLWWTNVADYGHPRGLADVNHPGIDSNDFLDRALEIGVGSGVLDDAGRTYIFEIEGYLDLQGR